MSRMSRIPKLRSLPSQSPSGVHIILHEWLQVLSAPNLPLVVVVALNEWSPGITGVRIIFFWRHILVHRGRTTVTELN